MGAVERKEVHYLNVLLKQGPVMDSSQFSLLSSLRGELKTEDYIQPHYKEAYRLAIDRLLSGGRDSYQEFLKDERVGSFLSEEELVFITTNAEQPPPESHTEEINGSSDSQSNKSSSGTYWPMLSDVETPDLDLGWPEVIHERVQTNVDLLFHPPRQNNPTIKEVIRKHIQDARQVIAIVMDTFTDVDLFKEIVDASKRGVPVYVLLSDFHLKGFLTMAEKQDINIQQLRNMRVRAVKGQEYLCRSGAKFHGAMDQKFVLVDCHTAIYGSYSFTWSYEKINLSMVQIITGHLVQAYDEEFRTLYARSIVPAELCPPEGLFQGRQIVPKCVTNSGPKMERNHLRHTLDMVYRKTFERRLSTREFDEKLCEEETLGPLENGIGVHTQMHDLQSAEMNYLKRHSYAGERQDGCIPQNVRSRASNWNISGDTGPNNYPTDNYLQASPMYRSQQIRQSYNGNDKHILTMQQNMPTLENTSKSFLRSWRIESYLKNADIPSGESSDYLDQFDPLDKASSFMQGRMRSSLVLRSPIPEQIEPNCHINDSIAASHLTSKSPLHYSSMQWNSTATPENRINNQDFRFKRQSLQILDDNEHYGPERNSYPLGYASLGRPKGRQIIPNPDLITDSWQKRHSVADPRSNSEYILESPGHMYGPFARIQANRNAAGINAQNGSHMSNLNEDQRSVSHYDVKSITGTKSPSSPIWQEPPSRTLSAAALGVNGPDLANKPSSSQHFSKKASSKIKSLLNIPEKKEGSTTILETGSLKSAGSTDTLTAEDERKISDRREQIRQSIKNSIGTSSGLHSRRITEDHLTSKPRFRTEEHPHQPQVFAVNTPQKKYVSADRNLKPSLDIGSWRKDRCAENRVYSRYEPFSSLENKHSLHTSPTFGNTQPQEKTKSLTRGAAAVEHNANRPARGHHENKLEKFFQRVGNLIHKHK